MGADVALTSTDADSLLTLWRSVVTELNTLRAQFAANGPLPAFSIDGVAVDWPAYQDHLIKMKDAYYEEYQTVLRQADGPCVIVTQGI